MVTICKKWKTLKRVCSKEDNDQIIFLSRKFKSCSRNSHYIFCWLFSEVERRNKIAKIGSIDVMGRLESLE